MASNFDFTFIKLSLPARYQQERVIPSMREKIVSAARNSYKAYNTAFGLPAIDELFEAYTRTFCLSFSRQFLMRTMKLMRLLSA